MVKESVNKCSYCGNRGHNSRTCNRKGCLKLFGVRIATDNYDDPIRKSLSTGNLRTCTPESDNAGYFSDGLNHSNGAHQRKKGVPWTEEEHRNFLIGLEKRGKGDWKGIAADYVPTRTSIQVASHAQKYFQRMAASDNKKRRSSLFDISLIKELALAPQVSPVLTSDKTVEISPQASTAQVMSMKKTVEIPAQATSAQVVNPAPAHHLESPPILPMAAARGVPDFRNVIPCMVGVSCNGQSFPAAKMIPTVSYVPVVNFPGRGYAYLPKTHGNFSTHAPVASHSPSSPSPPAGPGTTSTEKDGRLALDLPKLTMEQSCHLRHLGPLE